AAPGYLQQKTRDSLVSIQTACAELMTALLGEGDNQQRRGKENGEQKRGKQEGEQKQGLILRSGFAGSDYQYSHGLSVFFPWTQPSNEDFWPKEYRGYQFETTGWHDFLQRYFDNTMRDPRENESGHDQRLPMPVNAPLPVPPAEVVSDGKAKDKTYAGRTAWEKSEE